MPRTSRRAGRRRPIRCGASASRARSSGRSRSSATRSSSSTCLAIRIPRSARRRLAPPGSDEPPAETWACSTGSPATRSPRSPRSHCGRVDRALPSVERASVWYRTTVLETLAKGFRAARQRLTGVAELNDDVIDEALRDVRLSLLEGDVEFRVVKRFLERVKEAARGKQVELRAKSEEYGTKSITPEQAFIAICQDELVKMMGPVETDLRWAKKGPTGIMMCGLQGSGKTTTVGKLARWLEKTHKKKPMLVAADIYRPAAIDQLETLGRQLDVPVYAARGKDPVTICREANAAAAQQGRDVVIFDT